ncbi:MAG: nuclear transport factor 2 family protein [Acidimicrobiales bacterium]
MSDDLENRVRQLEDRAEITQLVARYGPAVDDREYENLAELYTQESVFDTVGGRITGRDEVIAYYKMKGDEYGATYHYPVSVEVHLDGPDDAHGVVCAHAELSIGDEAVAVALRYHDTYQREDDAWRFQERNVKILYVLPFAELDSGLAAHDRVRWPGMPRAAAALGPDVN